MGENALVTGVAGFIGSHVADHLLERGYEVTGLDDLSGGYRENVAVGVRFVEGSICDVDLVNELFRERAFTYVFHIAAYAAEGLSHFIRRFNYTNNIVGSMNLINAAVNHESRCFVFTSSIAVYGPAQVPMTEDMVPQPEDPYGIAKLAVEQDLAAARRMFGLHSVIFRPHNVYGERQNLADRYRNVVGIFMNQVMQGQPCTVFGDGEQTRAFTHIDDVARAIAASVETPAAYDEVFNLGADQPYSVNELAREVQRALGRDTGIVHLPQRHEVLHAFSDHRKAANVLGYRARITLPEGIARMAEWAKKMGPQRQSIFGAIEVAKNLPAGWAEFV